MLLCCRWPPPLSIAPREPRMKTRRNNRAKPPSEVLHDREHRGNQPDGPRPARPSRSFVPCDRDGHCRPARHGGSPAGRSADRRSHLARRRAGLGQNAGRPHARPGAAPQLQPYPVHAGPAARRRHRHADLQPAQRRLQHQERSGVRQPRSGRRDQSRPRQGAERPARSDAGEAGDHRRQQLPPRTAVPRPGDAEPHRTGGHLSACPKRKSIASCSSSSSRIQARKTN